MDKHSSRRYAKPWYPGDHRGEDEWIKSVGEVAAPLLAGFSFTTVIAVSIDAEHFLMPGAAILALTLAAVALIGAVQCAKYAREDRWRGADRHLDSARWTRLPFYKPYFSLSARERTAAWRRWMRRLYHFGITALLAGLGFALAPQHGTGTEYVLRWAASALAFAAGAIEASVFVTAGREDKTADGQTNKPSQRHARGGITR